MRQRPVAGGERIERPKPASKTGGFPLTEPPSSQWGDRRELNSRSWSHNPTPEPLGHGHIWCLRERSNLRDRLFRPALVHLSYAGELGGDGENRTLIGWVQTSSPPLERRPHGCGGGNRTCDLPCIRRMHSQPCSRSPEPRARIELASPLYRSGASPAMLTGLKTGASGANRTLVGRLPCACSPTELHRLEPKGGFEPPSERYEGSVFPTKLLRRCYQNPWSE